MFMTDNRNNSSMNNIEKKRRVGDYLAKNPGSTYQEITRAVPFSRPTVSRVLNKNREFFERSNTDASPNEARKHWNIDPEEIRSSDAFESDKIDDMLQSENRIVDELSKRGLLRDPVFDERALDFLREVQDIVPGPRIKEDDLRGDYEQGMPHDLAGRFFQIWFDCIRKAEDMRIHGALEVVPSREKSSDVDFEEEVTFMLNGEIQQKADTLDLPEKNPE